MNPILRLFLLATLVVLLSSVARGQTQVILIQDTQPSDPLLQVAANGTGQSGDLQSAPLPNGITTVTALGLVDFGAACGGATTGQAWQAPAPLGLLTLFGYDVVGPAIRVLSLDATNPYRTRADIPYRVYYTAHFTRDVSGVVGAEAGDTNFQVIRAVPAVTNGILVNMDFSTQVALPGVVSLLAPPGDDALLSATVGGTFYDRWYPLMPSAASAYREDVALALLPTTTLTNARIVALTSMEVLPTPSVTIDNLPTSTVTDPHHLPTLRIRFQNLYPGHVTFVTLTPSSGSTWTSASLIGTASGYIDVPLADVLPGMTATNNTITLACWSDSAVGNWQQFAAGQFIVNLNGSISLNVNTL